MKAKTVRVLIRAETEARLTITMPISRAEERALGTFKKKVWRGKDSGVNAADVAHLILRVALMHPEVVKAWITQVVRYCHLEGFNTGELEGQLRYMNGCIAAVKEYKRTPIYR